MNKRRITITNLFHHHRPRAHKGMRTMPTLYPDGGPVTVRVLWASGAIWKV